MAVSVNVGWERRICMFPTYFDKDDLMYADTYFGDYPHYAPSSNKTSGQFTGWMLLSYKKPVTVSSEEKEHTAENVVDESIKTFWLATENNDKQWITIDLLKPAEIRAIQINYHDYKSDMYGRIPDLYHQYTIEGSLDGKQWKLLIDKNNSDKDTPNDYVALASPQTVRYVRYKNKHVPTPHIAISGLRIFGLGSGKKPQKVKQFVVNRKADSRDSHISWERQKNAQGYNVLWGIAPDKLYSSWMVYDKNELELRSLTVGQTYYFAIEAFNENGVSERTKVQEVK